jgi:hypothetical protein
MRMETLLAAAAAKNAALLHTSLATSIPKMA